MLRSRCQGAIGWRQRITETDHTNQSKALRRLQIEEQAIWQFCTTVGVLGGILIIQYLESKMVNPSDGTIGWKVATVTKSARRFVAHFMW
jgi:hypothetical protein